VGSILGRIVVSKSTDWDAGGLVLANISSIDGTYETPDKKERSYFTLHLYLSDAVSATGEELTHLPKEERIKAASSAEAMGGATTFYSLDMRHRLDVLPKVGRILLFQHRDLLHSGDDVVRGVKYTMRTDLMYAREEAAERQVKDRNQDLGPDEAARTHPLSTNAEEDFYASEYARLERGGK
jgi:hypothetical protein